MSVPASARITTSNQAIFGIAASVTIALQGSASPEPSTESIRAASEDDRPSVVTFPSVSSGQPGKWRRSSRPCSTVSTNMPT